MHLVFHIWKEDVRLSVCFLWFGCHVNSLHIGSNGINLSYDFSNSIHMIWSNFANHKLFGLYQLKLKTNTSNKPYTQMQNMYWWNFFKNKKKKKKLDELNFNWLMKVFSFNSYYWLQNLTKGTHLIFIAIADLHFGRKDHLHNSRREHQCGIYHIIKSVSSKELNQAF